MRLEKIHDIRTSKTVRQNPKNGEYRESNAALEFCIKCNRHGCKAEPLERPWRPRAKGNKSLKKCKKFPGSRKSCWYDDVNF